MLSSGAAAAVLSNENNAKMNPPLKYIRSHLRLKRQWHTLHRHRFPLIKSIFETLRYALTGRTKMPNANVSASAAENQNL